MTHSLLLSLTERSVWMATVRQKKNLRREIEMEAFGVGSGPVVPAHGKERFSKLWKTGEGMVTWMVERVSITGLSEHRLEERAQWDGTALQSSTQELEAKGVCILGPQTVQGRPRLWSKSCLKNKTKPTTKPLKRGLELQLTW